MRIRGGLAACLLLAGCGGGGGGGGTPAGPVSIATPTPTPAPSGETSLVVTIVSGESGAPVAGATIRVPGTEGKTDGGGQFDLAGAATEGTALDVLADGFLHRETTLRAAELTLSAWPSSSPTGLDEAFTRQTLYTESDDGPLGDGPLVRLVASSVTFVPGPTVAGDAAARTTLEQGVAVLGSMLPQIPFRVADAPAGFTVETVVDPDDPLFDESPGAVGFTSLSINGRDEIVNARVVYRELAFARDPNVAHHEFGHVIGLGHAPAETDLMHCCSPAPVVFSARERLLVHLAYQRRPGNRFPDNDRSSISAGSLRERVIVCGQQAGGGEP